MGRTHRRKTFPTYSTARAKPAVRPTATGRVIAAQNGSGRSTFARGSPVWLKQDNGQRRGTTEADRRAADSITRRHVQAGHCVLVATWWDPAIVDAFVIVDASELARRGLTHSQLADAQQQADRCRAAAREHKIPVYDSFALASRAVLPRGHGTPA
jgi:hypothetical protein